ncbi:MAG: bacteriohemerythrin [Candidatus Caldatribacterium sp.]|uniref:bacteriohemerythrin n=1 Tax=Candidatus Caldatribacterium sp. TaxID=2282143 RepID=UPI002998F17F|nr:bacteriohemerythrin [Candidatus Caldatribacterium sp.]MCX7730560.1 bacteriohemerythrin [Candidatus Caldatribacterium sp.]MDW8081715.1 bacteriohemerythrin [Candidatus Calescibacterium sp.]
MVWSSNFATGIDVIDEQHKELFARTNRLLEACQEGRGREAVGETLKFLEDYVKTHFATEEGLMEKYGYPEFLDHKKLHESFTKAFMELKEKAKEGTGLALVTQVNKTVVDWWVNHILKVDKKLGAFLGEKMTRG